MEEVDMDGSESDQELTGNETDEGEWASKVHEHVWSMFIWFAPHKYDFVRSHILLTCTCIWQMSLIYMYKYKLQNV
jgi:hypothetical protein